MMFNKGLLENNVPVNKLKKKRFYNINVLETISTGNFYHFDIQILTEI